VPHSVEEHVLRLEVAEDHLGFGRIVVS
jgi:hypothetical protein